MSLTRNCRITFVIVSRGPGKELNPTEAAVDEDIDCLGGQEVRWQILAQREIMCMAVRSGACAINPERIPESHEPVVALR